MSPLHCRPTVIIIKNSNTERESSITDRKSQIWWLQTIQPVKSSVHWVVITGPWLNCSYSVWVRHTSADYSTHYSEQKWIFGTAPLATMHCTSLLTQLVHWDDDYDDDDDATTRGRWFRACRWLWSATTDARFDDQTAAAHVHHHCDKLSKYSDERPHGMGASPKLPLPLGESAPPQTNTWFLHFRVCK